MDLDMGTFRGIVTVVLMALFIALVIWAYSRRRHKDFSEAARLPLGDDDAPPKKRPGPEERKQGS